MTTPAVPRKWFDIHDHLARLADAVNAVLQGKTNNTGTITLTANQATTTLNDMKIGINSVINFMPTTANAAAELATLYVSSRGYKTATLTHANNAQIDRTFIYTVTG